MSKILWGIIKGTEPKPPQPNKLIEWQNKDNLNNAYSIIGLAFPDSELHIIDLDKYSKEILEELQQLFGAKTTNTKFKFSLKLQLFRFKMAAETTTSGHIKDLKSLIKHLALAEVSSKIDEENVKDLLLNSLPSTYNNIVFTLSQWPSQSLDELISSLLAEDKHLNEKLNEENSESALHPDNALLAKNRMSKKTGKQIGRC